MDLIDTLHEIMESSIGAYGMTDLTVGTVTKTAPLEVTLRETMAPLPQEVLWLTSAVIEKKIPLLKHEHITAGFQHNHTVSGLSHAHASAEGETGAALSGSFSASEGLTQDAFASDQRLGDVVCLENGKPLPVREGYIILNKGLEAGDKVLLLRVMRGQQFVILSRIFERRGVNVNLAAVQNRPDAGGGVPGPAVAHLDGGPGNPPASGAWR